MKIQTRTFKDACAWSGSLALGVWCFSGAWSSGCLELPPVFCVQIIPQFNGTELVFDSLTNTIASAQRISVTRLDFLLSNIAFRRADGTWTERTN